MGLTAIYNHASHLNSWACSHYSKSKTLRYSSYALAVFAVIAAYSRYDGLKLKPPLLAVSILIIGWNIRESRKNTHLPPLSLEKKLLRLSCLSSMIFNLALIWGIAIIGSQVRLTVIDGKNLLQGIRQRDLFAVLKALNQFCSNVTLGLPLSVFFVRKADAYFHSNLAETTRASFLQFLENNPHQKKKTLEHNISAWLKPPMDPKTFEFIFGKEGTEKYRLNTGTLSAILHFRQTTPSDLNKIGFMVSCILEALWKQKTVSNPSSPLLSKIKRIANSIFNHSFNFFLLSAKIYCYPVTLAVAFCCGLAFPTQLRLKQQIKKSWETVPDFVGLSLKEKCDYLFYRTFKTLVPLYFGYPWAFLEGLFLAEDFRYHLLPYLNEWVFLPIKPLVFEENRWRDFLKADFNELQKRESDLEDDPEYTHFRQKILLGASPRKALALEKGCTVKEVKTRYKKLSCKVHPDRIVPAKQEEATILFKCLKHARDLLLPKEDEKNLPQTPLAQENGDKQPIYQECEDKTSQPD